MPATMNEPRRERERVDLSAEIPAFTVEADHGRNCDLLLQSIPGCRLRSAISASKPAIDAKTGEPRIPRAQAEFLGQLPPLPGMQLTIDPIKRTYAVHDPLYTDKDLCTRIKSALNRIDGNPIRISGELRGVKPLEGKLDAHRMKTLCREINWIIEAGDAKVVRGSAPTVDQVDALPGNYLLNPGSQVMNSQPQFEKDFDAWVDKLHASGG